MPPRPWLRLQLRPPEPATIPVRKNPTVIAAAVAAAGAVIVGLVTLTGQLVAAQLGQNRGPEKACVAVFKEYRDVLGGQQDLARILTEPGDDGISVLDADTNARRCGLDARTIRELAE